MAHLRRQTGALLEASAQLGTQDPSAVHAARVATRRLRSGLKVYGDLLQGDAAATLRPELSWYAGALSAVRDLDVFADQLSAGGGDEALSEAVLPWLRRRRDVEVSDAVTAIGSARAEALRVRLVDLARTPRFTGAAGKRAAKVLTPRVLDADRRAARILDAVAPHDPSGEWHAARIAAKRARYAAEFGALALGRPCADLAGLWSRLTEPLGSSQDCVIQRALVLDRVDDASVPLTAGEAFACGIFVAGTHDRERALHAEARTLWRGVQDERRRIRRAVAA